jgi:hypothetical protein
VKKLLNEEKVDDIFTLFLQSGQGGSDDIEQIYNTLPYLTHDQQRVLTLYNALAVKHNSAVLKELSASITKFAETNRKTGIRFTRMIESYSLYKHFKGFQMSGNVGDDKK